MAHKSAQGDTRACSPHLPAVRSPLRPPFGMWWCSPCTLGWNSAGLRGGGSLPWCPQWVRAFMGHRCGQGSPCCWPGTCCPLSLDRPAALPSPGKPPKLGQAPWPACHPSSLTRPLFSPLIGSESEQTSVLPEFQAPEGRPVPALTCTVSLPGAPPAVWPSNHVNE